MEKQEIFAQVETLKPVLTDMSRALWREPELGGSEEKSSDYARNVLKNEGFQITGVGELPYAFCAEYGTGSPVIAILGEYDALPGLSQTCSTKKEPVEKGGAGHGCGHNLLGSAAVTGAIAIKRVMEQEHLEGTIRFYGCPEEELLSGKVKMAYYHMFDGCDLAISWHPMTANMVYDEGFLANASAHYYFRGKTSHAAFAPELGRSALDAVELMNVGANYLREHVIDKARIHYTTDSGGFSPNIVPDYASAWYYTRAPHMQDVQDILRRLEKIAQGAALMTETEVEVKVDCGCCEKKSNQAFTKLTYDNMVAAGEIQYTEEELQFAREIQNSLDPALLKKDQERYGEERPMYIGTAPKDLGEKIGLYSSSDSGDVSQMMPMNLFCTACWPMGCAPHTWQAASASGSSIGEKGALHAAKIIAGTAYDLLVNEEMVREIKEEFEVSKPNYKPMYKE